MEEKESKKEEEQERDDHIPESLDEEGEKTVMGQQKYLTDEEYNELFDTIAKNEALTPEEMEALSTMRENMYVMMADLKNAKDWESKYNSISDAYKKRWRQPGSDTDRTSGTRETNKFTEKEEPDGEKKIDDLFEKKEG